MDKMKKNTTNNSLFWQFFKVKNKVTFLVVIIELMGLLLVFYSRLRYFSKIDKSICFLFLFSLIIFCSDKYSAIFLYFS